MIRSFQVPDSLVGQRVDVAVSQLTGVSRARAVQALDAGAVFVNDEAVTKSQRVGISDTITVELDAIADPVVTRSLLTIANMNIVYNDEDIVIVDKPPGVAAHASMGWQGPNVLDGLLAAGFRIATSGAPERQGIVQRLDVGTSGLMVVAKSERAYSVLKRAFKERTVTKEYVAVCHGRPQPELGTIDAPIGRHRSGAYKFQVDASGRHAITHYEVVASGVGASQVRIRLETGRTHQIRVHFQAIGHPLVGDLTYGADPTVAARLGLSRQFLHASHLAFSHPITTAPVSADCVLSPDLAAAWKVLDTPI